MSDLTADYAPALISNWTYRNIFKITFSLSLMIICSSFIQAHASMHVAHLESGVSGPIFHLLSATPTVYLSAALGAMHSPGFIRTDRTIVMVLGLSRVQPL